MGGITWASANDLPLEFQEERQVPKKRAGESFAKIKTITRKLSDVMMGLIAIHAFLGFLYLLQLIG